VDNGRLLHVVKGVPAIREAEVATQATEAAMRCKDYTSLRTGRRRS
jgi:hypothetical protein